MSDDDVILSELRRRIEAISIERDNATLALSKVREEEEKKRARLRAEVRDLSAEVGELRRRVKSRDQVLIRERDEARRGGQVTLRYARQGATLLPIPAR